MSSKLLRGAPGLTFAPLHHVIRGGGAEGGTPEREDSPPAARAAERREREAFEKGVTEGRRTAQQERAERLDALEQKLGPILESFSAIEQRLQSEVEEDLVELALAIARRVLHRETSTDPEAVAALARAAMDRMAKRSLRRVRTHASHQETIAAIIEKRCIPGSVEPIADPTLEPGDLIFEAERGELDASVDSQLDEIRRGLVDRGGRRS